MQNLVLSSAKVEDKLIVLDVKDGSSIYLATPSIERFLLSDDKITMVSLDIDDQNIVFNESKSFKLSELSAYSFPISDYELFKLATLRLQKGQKFYLLIASFIVVAGIFFKTPIVILCGTSMLIASLFLLCGYCILKDLPMYFKGSHLLPTQAHSLNRKLHLFLGGMVLFTYLCFILIQVVSSMQLSS